MREEVRYYLSPICTKNLGDALVSISNLYHRLEPVLKPIVVYYHHWPVYFDLLWPHIRHPRDGIRFERLDNSSADRIDDSLEETYKDLLFREIKRSDYRWHPSRAYSLEICRQNKIIQSDLVRLGIGEENILVNCTDLDLDAKYVEIKAENKDRGYVTYQSTSISSRGVLRQETREVVEFIKSQDRPAINVNEIDQIDKLIETLSGSGHHYGIDSGPTHLCLAMRVPLTVFFDKLFGHKGLEGILAIYGDYVNNFSLVDCRKTSPYR